LTNTSYLRYVVEPWIRTQLQVLYGQRFESRVLRLHPGGGHEFDAVSEDESVVAAIKTSTGKTSGGNHPTGKVAACLNDIYYLSLIDANVRLLILTNPEFHAIFMKTTTGKIAPGIEVKLITLPADLQIEVSGISQRASDEMSGLASVSISSQHLPDVPEGFTAALPSEDESLPMPQTGSAFWTYENRIHKYSRVHKPECAHCNAGQGSHNAMDSTVGHWIGPFSSLNEASNASTFATLTCTFCTDDSALL
jgi:hypothetical protein